MTLYDKGLIKAMKKAYRNSGYDVAVTDNGVLIQTASWGVQILAEAVPNSVKSLIVLHNGSMPRMNTAVCIQKDECASAFPETTCSTIDQLDKAYTETSGIPIKPTRLTFDGMRVWQTENNLRLRLVDVENQQILTGDKWDARLVCGFIYGRTWFGSMFVQPELTVPEDRPLIDHLAVMAVLHKQKVKCDREQAERVAWRIVKDWVEAQMAILESEMVHMDEIFLPYMVNNSGQTFFQAYRSNQLLLEE